MFGTVVASRLRWALIFAAVIWIPNLCESTADVPRYKACGTRMSELVIAICKPYGGLYDPSAKVKRDVSEEAPKGITAECCNNEGCTIEQIFQYCQNPPAVTPEITKEITSKYQPTASKEEAHKKEEKKTEHEQKKSEVRAGHYSDVMGDDIPYNFIDNDDDEEPHNYVGSEKVLKRVKREEERKEM